MHNICLAKLAECNLFWDRSQILSLRLSDISKNLSNFAVSIINLSIRDRILSNEDNLVFAG